MKKYSFWQGWLLAGLLLCVTISIHAKTVATYPTHWWAGMKWNQVQLLVHADGINSAAPVAKLSYPGVTLKKTTRTESNNYVVLDLSIAATVKPGVVNINIETSGKKQRIPFEIKPRRKGNGSAFAKGESVYRLVRSGVPVPRIYR